MNSKWIKHLNVRTKSIKLLEKNRGQKLHSIALGDDFLAMTPKAQATKETIDNVDNSNEKLYQMSEAAEQEVTGAWRT